MYKRIALMFMLCALAYPFAVSASGHITFDGCIDGAGAPVPSVLDPSIGTAFAARMEGGRPVIRYNPAIVPRMQEHTRLFLFAHECARINLGFVVNAPRMLADARRADCRGLVTLLRSGLIDDQALAAIQSDLQFSVDEWPLLPGPPRGFDLAGCTREHAARQSLVHPAPGQDDWNTCARTCGDALLACQQGICRGLACEPCVQRYEQCIAACDASFSR